MFQPAKPHQPGLNLVFKCIWGSCSVMPAKAGYRNAMSEREDWQNQGHFHLSVYFLWPPITFFAFSLLVYFTSVTGICTANNCLGRWPWYCHKDNIFSQGWVFLEPFIQWIRLSCIRAQRVFLFELSASLRFIRFYSRHFSPGIFHFLGFLMFCRGSIVSCKCYVTLNDFF